MSAISAGLLVWRPGDRGPAFLLVHPGGPFWKNRDVAAWSIPKGLVDDGEDLVTAAYREFAEELGQSITTTGIALAPCRTSGGKTIHAWLVEADLDVSVVRSNLFSLEWPPRCGTTASFPEVDRASYFDADVALAKVHKGQRPILVEAIGRLVRA